MAKKNPRGITLTEGAALVGKSVSKLRLAAQRGELPAEKVGQSWVTRKNVLLAWAAGKPIPEFEPIISNDEVLASAAAKILDVTHSRVKALITSAILPAEMVCGQWVIKTSDLDAIRHRPPGRRSILTNTKKDDDGQQ
jgi:hypothetical protein